MLSSTRRRRTLSRNDANTFPLPDDFFSAIQLTDAQVRSFQTQVEDIVRKALEEYEQHQVQPLYSAPWVLVGTEGPLTAVRKESPEELAHSDFRLYGCIHGDYQQFMEYHYAETSRAHFECAQFMFGYAVDAVVLKNIHTRDSNRPHEYMGLKWTCLQPSSFGHKRDNCFLEYLTYRTDKLGRQVGVRATLPVELPECPDLYPSLKIKRMKAQSVCIVRPAGSSADATQLFLMSTNDFAGLSPSARNFRKYLCIYNDMPLIADSKHILKHGIVSKDKWVANDERRACTRCQLPFNTATRRRSHCRLCGDLFCRHCVILRNVPRDDSKSRVFQLTKTHFCMTCVSRVRRGSHDALPVLTSERGRALSLARGGGACQSLSYDTRGVEGCKAMSTGHEQSSSVRQEWWNDLEPYHGSVSEWSETDSEDASKASFSLSGRSRAANPLSSSQSSWTTARGDTNNDSDNDNTHDNSDNNNINNSVDRDDSLSFIATLDVIDDDVAILAEKREPHGKFKLQNQLVKAKHFTTSRRRLPRKQLLLTPHMSSGGLREVAEGEDTTDVIPIVELRRRSRAESADNVLLAPSGQSEELALVSPSGFDRRLTGDEPTARFRSSRSISQCLAEQEELLRRMLDASRAHSSSGAGVLTRRRSKPAKVNLSATMPASMRLYEY
ncbi:unnamed protein product [Hyaloperonospora brassicae]|uniref:FYVE-type domain-containing protein n=1 Tax=Hyaloperonospora brassicae TaxID=162125 RepID=A0AAV0V6L9_HYABA|nr:unnamed protein product [Hyaloperonospora brassicae]